MQEVLNVMSAGLPSFVRRIYKERRASVPAFFALLNISQALRLCAPIFMTYIDKRETFWREYFNTGLSYEAYVKTGTSAQQFKWQQVETAVTLTDEQLKIISTFKRKMPVIILSGIWCGDCSRQGPILRAIEKASSVIELKFVESKTNPDLQNELRICGAERVPVLVALSEEFFEVQRFGDKHLSIYQRKMRTELGDACDAGIVLPDADEFAIEINEWVKFFERVQLLLRLAPGLRRKWGD